MSAMEQIIPRYEFRAFAQNFGPVEAQIRQISPRENIRESAEIYIVSPDNDENNAKIRYDTLDIKVLIGEYQGLEQWKPRFKQAFPLQTQTLHREVLPALGVEPPELSRATYSLEQFIDEVVWPHPGLFVAHVFKRRFGFSVSGCITEVAELLVNGAAIQTLAIESEDAGAVLQTKDILGLGAYENVNYLRAIKRIMGLAPLPDAWFKA